MPKTASQKEILDVLKSFQIKYTLSAVSEMLIVHNDEHISLDTKTERWRVIGTDKMGANFRSLKRHLKIP